MPNTNLDAARLMIELMRTEAEKFPEGYVSSYIDPSSDDAYGDGPMSDTGPRDGSGFGVEACLVYWAGKAGVYRAFSSFDLQCGISWWPNEWREKYKAAKDVREQYRVMVGYTEEHVNAEAK